MKHELELLQKRKKYKDYIDEHRKYVKLAFDNFKRLKCNALSKEELLLLTNEVENHDMSKYGLEEFEAYRIHFFPCTFENKDDAKEDFEFAKKHHYLVNDHHPQNPTRKEGLNKVACIHNILDWIAMSYKFNDSIWQFYENSGIGEKLNTVEREFVEEILDLIKTQRELFYKEEIER